jgi:hypothetical protein
MLIRKLSAAATVLSLCGVAAPVAGAAPATPVPPAAASPLLTFVPPKVGPLSVNLGPTIIGGQLISPGVNVYTPGVSLPPFTWTPPAFTPPF